MITIQESHFSIIQGTDRPIYLIIGLVMISLSLNFDYRLNYFLIRIVFSFIVVGPSHIRIVIIFIFVILCPIFQATFAIFYFLVDSLFYPDGFTLRGLPP